MQDELAADWLFIGKTLYMAFGLLYNINAGPLQSISTDLKIALLQLFASCNSRQIVLDIRRARQPFGISCQVHCNGL